MLDGGQQVCVLVKHNHNNKAVSLSLSLALLLCCLLTLCVLWCNALLHLKVGIVALQVSSITSLCKCQRRAHGVSTRSHLGRRKQLFAIPSESGRQQL
jgi:hypothetical protein